MKKYCFYIVLALNLVVSCQCKDMRLRQLPEERVITFKGTLEVPKEVRYLGKNTSIPIKLRLTSEDEAAKNLQFQLVSWKVANGKKGILHVSSLQLGDNILSYTPKEPGTHELTIKVAIEGEEDSVQTFQCTIEATQADWKVEGAVDATGELTIQIADVPAALRGERWHITETAWSKGLQGNIVHDPPGLTHGDNNLQVALHHIDLEAAPALHLTIKGPDEQEVPLIIDLTEACIAQLMADLANRGTEAEQWCNDSQVTRGQEIDDTEAAKSDKCSKLETLLAQLRVFQAQYQKNIKSAWESLAFVDNPPIENTVTRQ